MSQKHFEDIIDYSNNSQNNTSVNMIIDLDNKNSKNKHCYEKNNYNQIHNIAIDIVNSRNSYYLKNICLDK